jgi:hypothetical protein
MNVTALLDSIPTPSAEEVNQHNSRARHYTLVFLRKGPADRSDEAQETRMQLEHIQYRMKLHLLGKLVLNGPILTDHDILGVGVYAAELEEALALAQADPKVKAGYLIAEAVPWIAVATLKNFSNTREAVDE